MDALTVSTITGAVDFATVITGIGAIGAAVALVLVSMKGVKLLFRAMA